MDFETFSIRRVSDNTDVSLAEVDSIVRKELALKNCEMDKPYGHFYFTETAEDLNGFQASISWAGLIHTIVYFSDICYGKASAYDIEAAMAWSKAYAVHFPNSVVMFTHNLLNVLEESGYYVFVKWHPAFKGHGNFFVCSNNANIIHKNESGLFECDDRGGLLNFYPGRWNILEKEDKLNHSLCLHTLIIPEGVTSFVSESFRNVSVADELRFPSTLRQIGSGICDFVFSGCDLPEVIITKLIRTIGVCAFERSHIKRLVIKDPIDFEYARQFEDSIIDEIVIPQAMLERLKNVFSFSKASCVVKHVILT